MMCERKGILSIHAPFFATLQVHNTRTDVLILFLAHLALSVEVPDWLGQGLEDVGALRGERVIDVVRRDDVRLAALESLSNA